MGPEYLYQWQPMNATTTYNIHDETTDSLVRGGFPDIEDAYREAERHTALTGHTTGVYDNDGDEYPATEGMNGDDDD